MPFTIDTDGPILRVLLSGTLTNEDLSGIARAADEIEPTYEVVPHRLTDTRQVSRLEITFHGVLDLARQRLVRKFPNAFKSAIVASDVAHFGFARMFQTLNDHPQIVIAIFGDDGVALRWLEEPGLEPPRQSWTPHSYAL